MLYWRCDKELTSSLEVRSLSGLFVYFMMITVV